MPSGCAVPVHSPTNDRGRRHPSTVSLILAPAACSSPTASIADFHLSALHLAVHTGAVSRPSLLRIQSTSYTGRIFTGPLGNIQPWSHVRSHVSCLGVTRWDFCNGSEVLHPLRSTTKTEIAVSRPRHQNEVNARTWSPQPGKHANSTVDQGEHTIF